MSFLDLVQPWATWAGDNVAELRVFANHAAAIADYRDPGETAEDAAALLLSFSRLYKSLPKPKVSLVFDAAIGTELVASIEREFEARTRTSIPAGHVALGVNDVVRVWAIAKLVMAVMRDVQEAKADGQITLQELAAIVQKYAGQFVPLVTK